MVGNAIYSLSLKADLLSLFTLDGRMRFRLALQPDAEVAFHTCKLREIVLLHRADGEFELSFWLDRVDEPAEAAEPVLADELPAYLIVEEQAA